MAKTALGNQSEGCVLFHGSVAMSSSNQNKEPIQFPLSPRSQEAQVMSGQTRWQAENAAAKLRTWAIPQDEQLIQQTDEGRQNRGVHVMNGDTSVKG